MLVLDNQEQTMNIASPHSSDPKRNKSGPVRLELSRRIDTMIAPLGTLVFLATLWLLVVVGASVLEESGARVAAALKGVRLRRQMLVPVRVRGRLRWQKPMRAKPRWRAAA
jgi:hypothetical protein